MQQEAGFRSPREGCSRVRRERGARNSMGRQVVEGDVEAKSLALVEFEPRISEIDAVVDRAIHIRAGEERGDPLHSGPVAGDHLGLQLASVKRPPAWNDLAPCTPSIDWSGLVVLAPSHCDRLPFRSKVASSCRARVSGEGT